MTYKQHGGSGTNLTVEDVLDLELERINWWIDWVGDQRARESRKIRQAVSDAKAKRT